MKKHLLLFLALLLLVCNTQTARGQKELDWLEPVITSTNLTLKFPVGQAHLFIDQKTKGVERWSADGEELVLTPDCETNLLFWMHGHISFTPVTFKNGLQGFRVFHVADGRSFNMGVTIKTEYVALSDTPVTAREEDLTDESRVLSEEESKWWQLAIITKKRHEEQQEEERKRREAQEEGAATLPTSSTEPPASNGSEEKSPDASPPPCRVACRSWLWWLALPAVAGAGFVFHLGKRRK